MQELQSVPVLYPSEEEFENPIEYLSKPNIKALGDQFGMVKISPPSSFKPPLSINEDKFSFIPRIQKLKELNILNRCRLFFYKQLMNFNKMNGKTGDEVPKDSFQIIEDHKVHYYDFFIEVVKYYKGGNVLEKDKKTLPNIKFSRLSNDEELWRRLSKHFHVQVLSLMEMFSMKLSAYFNYLSEKSEFTNTLVEEKYPTSLLSDHDSTDEESSDNDDDDSMACLVCKSNSDPENTLLCDSCDKPFHMKCLSPPLTSIPKNNWYCDNCVIGNGYYGFKDSTIRYSLEDFQQLSNEFDKNYFQGKEKPSLKKLETMFWDLVDDIDNDLKVQYGADVHNLRKGEVSGFPTIDYMPKNTHLTKDQYEKYVNHPMNLNNLPYDKSSLLNYLDVDISGMTIPWIYVGNTFSTFCWHVEDQYTLSANYQHLGATKKWYSIPSQYAEKFENYMKGLAPDLFAKQPDILHQLITLVSPTELIEKAGIPCFTTDQEPGEYVITYPRVYHAGFNAGFNFNEAVNFTMVDWLDYGMMSTINYKKNVDKVSVFDIYEMMMNILNVFTSEETLDHDMKLINKCLGFLKPRLTDEYSLKSTILGKLDKKPLKHERGKTKSQVEGQNYEDVEEDGILCCQCKGFCTFNYIKHYEPISIRQNLSYLPTPRSSPEELSSSTKRRRISKRIKELQEADVYKVKILCLNDYIRDCEINMEKDEMFVIKELDSVKELINEVEEKKNLMNVK